MHLIHHASFLELPSILKTIYAFHHDCDASCTKCSLSAFGKMECSPPTRLDFSRVMRTNPPEHLCLLAVDTLIFCLEKVSGSFVSFLIDSFPLILLNRVVCISIQPLFHYLAASLSASPYHSTNVSITISNMIWRFAVFRIAGFARYETT